MRLPTMPVRLRSVGDAYKRLSGCGAMTESHADLRAAKAEKLTEQLNNSCWGQSQLAIKMSWITSPHNRSWKTALEYGIILKIGKQ